MGVSFYKGIGGTGRSTKHMPREHERVPYLTEVVLEFASGRREARVSDLSEGGCYVESWAVGVRVGDTVGFELQMPGGALLPVVGEVAYATEGMGFGVKFLGQDEMTRSRIREFVEAEAAVSR